MKRLLFILLFLVSVRTYSADPTVSHSYSTTFRKTDRGLFCGTVGDGRMYVDITLPPLTPALLVDVGMGMSQVPGLIGMIPRWFAMFSPIACPYDELYATPKSTIFLTFRTYF